MATKKIVRLECRCESCGHRWTTRTDRAPAQCPAPECGKRRHVWNASEAKRLKTPSRKQKPAARKRG